MPQYIFALIMIGMISRTAYGFIRLNNNPTKFRSILRSASSGTPAVVKQMSVEDFGKILKSDNRSLYQIVDVREPDELIASSIPGSDIINLPLSQASEWSTKVAKGDILDKDKPTLCLCKAGMRSMRVATYLATQVDFAEVYNIEGGIYKYAIQVDPSIPTY